MLYNLNLFYSELDQIWYIFKKYKSKMAKVLLTLFHVGGGGSFFPPHQFLLNNFFCKNRIDLKLLDFLSYTYTHPKHLKNLKFFDFFSNFLKSQEVWDRSYFSNKSYSTKTDGGGRNFPPPQRGIGLKGP